MYLETGHAYIVACFASPGYQVFVFIINLFFKYKSGKIKSGKIRVDMVILFKQLLCKIFIVTMTLFL